MRVDRAAVREPAGAEARVHRARGAIDVRGAAIPARAVLVPVGDDAPRRVEARHVMAGARRRGRHPVVCVMWRPPAPAGRPARS